MTETVLCHHRLHSAQYVSGYSHTESYLTFEIFVVAELVLTDQPSLVLQYSESYLVVKELYGATLEEDQAVLDIVQNALVVNRRNETSPTQKWTVSSSGTGIFFSWEPAL